MYMHPVLILSVQSLLPISRNDLAWVNQITDYVHSLSCHDVKVSELY